VSKDTRNLEDEGVPSEDLEDRHDEEEELR
jgi:hypothetical protein